MNAKVYWIYEVTAEGNKKVEGPYSFDKAYWIAARKNGPNGFTYFVDSEVQV